MSFPGKRNIWSHSDPGSLLFDPEIKRTLHRTSQARRRTELARPALNNNPFYSSDSSSDSDTQSSSSVSGNYKEKKLGAKHNLKKEEELKNQGNFKAGAMNHARTAFRPRLGVGFHHSPRLGVAKEAQTTPEPSCSVLQTPTEPHDRAIFTLGREPNASINLRGNDTLLTLYYLIRSGALAGGSLRFRKDFGHQIFGAVAGD
ncbi:hypothetical protein PIB30_048795 [Stylosanthes scabra]|uniref:Uncharacterized protein n=1 Tax=Stylosanthes scabra TaxID=79078 RepID=A0ABU6WH23_9FABA|nr:hypothetical protein [Stylosanthes scabra]